MSITRRDFIGTGAAAAAASLALPTSASAEPVATSVVGRSSLVVRPPTVFAPPIVIGAENGFISRNASGKTGIEVAYEMLTRGADPLDAVIAGVNVVERDPNDQSVGIGGLPNEEGVVQLDASVMHGPTKRAGVAGRESGHGLHRSHHARRRGRKEVRARVGIQRRKPAHRPEPPGLAALEGDAQSHGRVAQPATACGSSALARAVRRPRLPR